MRSIRTTALVIGAGPAGASAAFRLARSGIDTILADAAVFPRDKICGDALIPDAIAALTRAGLLEVAASGARFLRGIRVFAPSGADIMVEGTCACLPRRTFDDALRRAAADAGAQFWAPYTATAAVEGAAVRGAVLTNNLTRDVVRVEADVTILATGAGLAGLTRLGVLRRREPSAVAARAYFEVRAGAAAPVDELWITYDRAILPGYGWVFPGPGGIFNIGVGYFIDSRTAASRSSVADLWSRFTRGFEPMRPLLSAARQISPLRGAPIRTAMKGSLLAKPGLLVIGEAAGLTYSFSGEGIGKAIESGLLAAELIADARAAGAIDPAIGARYAAALCGRFGSRFDAYATAQRWLEHAWLADFLASRARRSAFVRNQLQGLFNETADPATLFSWSGLVRSLFPSPLVGSRGPH